MDFVLTEAQRELAALTRQVVSGQAGRAGARADAGPAAAGPAGLDAGLWAGLAQAGVLAAALPESLGGAGAGLLEQCSVLAELGRAVAAAPYLSSVLLGAGAIARFGTPAQQQRWAARPAAAS